MSIKIKNVEYDYAADCFTCSEEFKLFATKQERNEWLKDHKEHHVDLYLHAHV